jgi:hypothetical protein
MPLGYPPRRLVQLLARAHDGAAHEADHGLSGHDAPPAITAGTAQLATRATG